MEIEEIVGPLMEQIKRLKGVERVLLFHKDGFPIWSSGRQFTNEELMKIGMVTSQLHYLGSNLRPDEEKYVLIESRMGKILILPLSSEHKFFIVLVAQPNINLGGLYQQSTDIFNQIKNALHSSGKSFKALKPEINDTLFIEKVRKMTNSYQATDFDEKTHVLDINENLKMHFRKAYNSIERAIRDLKHYVITSNTGQLVSYYIKEPSITEEEIKILSLRSFYLSQFAAWAADMLKQKKLKVDSILIDYFASFQFINPLKNGLFIIEIGKMQQKLGLIRLILPQFSKRLENLLDDVYQEG